MSDYQRYTNLTIEIANKKNQIVALQNRIQKVCLEPEVVSDERIVAGLRQLYTHFMDDYPFFTYRQGKSGTLETKTILFYKGLSNNGSYTDKKIILGIATSGNTYPTGRTTIARTYANASGKQVTTTANLNPSGDISASSSFCGHFKGQAEIAPLRNSMMSIPIQELVSTQENELDSSTAIRKAHYPRSLFSDLEDVPYSPQDLLDMLERVKDEVVDSEVVPYNTQELLGMTKKIEDEVVARLNAEIASITDEISVLMAEQITIAQNIDSVLTQSQTELQEKQDALNNLEQALENLEQNNSATLAEIATMQEEIARLEAELENLNNANPEYTQNLQELESLNNRKTTLESQITNFTNIIATKETELESARNEVSAKEQEIQTLQNQSTRLESEINALNSQKQNLESQIQDTRNLLNENSAKKPTLEAEITKLQEQKAELENALQEANAKIVELQSQKQESQTILTAKTQELESLQLQITQAQSELDALREQNAELESNLTQKRTEVQTLREAIANYDANALNAELQVLLTQIPQKQQELAELEALLAQNQGNKGVLDELQAQITEKRAELDSYADSEIYKAQEKLEILKKKLEAILNTNSFVLESDLKDLHTRALSLAKDLKIEICQSQGGVEYIPQSDKPKNFVGYRYIAKDGERLDSIVYAHYGTLDLFQSVLLCNPNLLNHRILRAGEIVWLPSADTKAKSLENKLWS